MQMLSGETKLYKDHHDLFLCVRLDGQAVLVLAVCHFILEAHERTVLQDHDKSRVRLERLINVHKILVLHHLHDFELVGDHVAHSLAFEVLYLGHELVWLVFAEGRLPQDHFEHLPVRSLAEYVRFTVWSRRFVLL